MGDAKRRGSFEDRKQTAIACRELEEAMRREIERKRREAEAAAFAALPPDVQNRILEGRAMQKRRNDRMAALVMAGLTMSDWAKVAHSPEQAKLMGATLPTLIRKGR